MAYDGTSQDEGSLPPYSFSALLLEQSFPVTPAGVSTADLEGYGCDQSGNEHGILQQVIMHSLDIEDDRTIPAGGLEALSNAANQHQDAKTSIKL